MADIKYERLAAAALNHAKKNDAQMYEAVREKLRALRDNPGDRQLRREALDVDGRRVYKCWVPIPGRFDDDEVFIYWEETETGPKVWHIGKSHL